MKDCSHRGAQALSNQSAYEASIAPDWIEQMTHECVSSCQTERARHKSFITARLAAAVIVLLLAPVWLAVHGAPTLSQWIIFLLAQAPLISVGALVRSGNLRFAQSISILGWVLMALVVDATTQGYETVSIMLLTVALIEAASTLEIMMVSIIIGLTIGYLAIEAGLHATDASHTAYSRHTMNIALFVAPMLLYLASMAICAIRAEHTRLRADQRNARDLRLLTGAIGDIVLHFDHSGAVSSIVGDIYAHYGLESRDLLGRGFFQRVHVGDRPAFLKLVSDAVATGAPVNVVLRVQVGTLRHMGQRQSEPTFCFFDARACYASTEDERDDAAPVVCIMRDVTEAKRAEEELAIARAQSEVAVESKTRFLANVSHELRTPLNAIIGFSDMLSNPELEPADPMKRREYAKIISDSGHHLLEVVNTILDMSKIDSGAMQLFPEPFALAALADQCCDMMQLRAEQSGVTLVRDYPDKLEEIVADKRACKQIIINLLSNAVKFTPASGRVKVRLRPEGNFLLLSVIDTGIGIAAQDLARFGDPFFQASSSHARAYEGTGLGLSVVRGLVGLHGGSITVESAPKKGTSIIVRLPLDCRNQKIAMPPMAKIETIARHGAQSSAGAGSEREVVKKIA
jgi:cell cycle sensor histidine kinase DivJ